MGFDTVCVYVCMCMCVACVYVCVCVWMHTSEWLLKEYCTCTVLREYCAQGILYVLNILGVRTLCKVFFIPCAVSKRLCVMC